MDRTSVCGTDDPSSILGESTKIKSLGFMPMTFYFNDFTKAIRQVYALNIFIMSIRIYKK
jgi:hypothetical protein